MRVRLLASATRDGVLDCFQLHDYAGETLRERVVNVARQAISFLQNGRLPASLGEFIELNCEHRLVSQCLRQLDLLRPIRRSVAMPNPDEPSHTAAHEGWNSQELFRSSSFQVIPKIAGCVRIMFHIFASDRRSGKKQLAKARILLPR